MTQTAVCVHTQQTAGSKLLLPTAAHLFGPGGRLKSFLFEVCFEQMCPAVLDANWTPELKKCFSDFSLSHSTPDCGNGSLSQAESPLEFPQNKSANCRCLNDMKLASHSNCNAFVCSCLIAVKNSWNIFFFSDHL